jgi:hypothetical protein
MCLEPRFNLRAGAADRQISLDVIPYYFLERSSFLPAQSARQHASYHRYQD